MTVADPCGLGEAVQASRAVRVGGLWVWDHSTAGRTDLHVPRNDVTISWSIWWVLLRKYGVYNGAPWVQRVNYGHKFGI